MSEWGLPSTTETSDAPSWDYNQLDTFGSATNRNDCAYPTNNGETYEQQGHLKGDGGYEGEEGYEGGGGGGGACFGCGEMGHRRAECPNPTPREFTGTCRICEQEGHRASDCPSKPPTICRNCGEEGHEAFGCENARKINRDHVQKKTVEEAWALIQTAVNDRDLDDLKEAIEIYIKAEPETTYQQLEEKFREKNIGVYIIALEKELAVTYTNMDFQGHLDKTYSITWRWSPKPMRPKEIPFWPSTPEENFERLADAGEPTDRGVPKCSNCNTLGHTRRRCPEEVIEMERATVLCFNCNQTGHRMRDCPEPRTDRFACKNCNQSGHQAAECLEPRFADGVECNNCHKVGHRGADCPNETVIMCRNCDEVGHMARECPLPRDYSRVKCQNCQQMGHTKVRCTEPLQEPKYPGDYGGDTYNTEGNNASAIDWGTNNAGTSDWQTNNFGASDWNKPTSKDSEW